MAGWTGASIVFTHASGADTYTVADDVLNAYDVAVALRDWLDSGSRPWTASINAVYLTVGDDGVRHRFEFTYSGTSPTFVSVVPNATWIARFGDTSASPVGVCPQTCAATPGSGPWERWDSDAGDRSRTSGWRRGHPATAHRQPSVELAMSLEQAYAFTAALRLASQPRTAYLYDELTALWRFVTCGAWQLEHPDGDPTVMVGSLEVVGGV